MLEKAVEEHLRTKVQALGGRCIKLDPTNAVGITDRLVILNNRVFFAELKRPRGGVLSRAQVAWRRWLIGEQSQTVVTLHTKSAIDDFLDQVMEGHPSDRCRAPRRD